MVRDYRHLGTPATRETLWEVGEGLLYGLPVSSLTRWNTAQEKTKEKQCRITRLLKEVKINTVPIPIYLANVDHRLLMLMMMTSQTC